MTTFYGSDPFNADGVYTFRSPIYHVRKVQTPTLFLHGEQDPICPPGQAHEMWRALKELGVESGLVIYPAPATDLASASMSATCSSVW